MTVDIWVLHACHSLARVSQRSPSKESFLSLTSSYPSLPSFSLPLQLTPPLPSPQWELPNPIIHGSVVTFPSFACAVTHFAHEFWKTQYNINNYSITNDSTRVRERDQRTKTEMRKKLVLCISLFIKDCEVSFLSGSIKAFQVPCDIRTALLRALLVCSNQWHQAERVISREFHNRNCEMKSSDSTLFLLRNQLRDKLHFLQWGPLTVIPSLNPMRHFWFIFVAKSQLWVGVARQSRFYLTVQAMRNGEYLR